MSTSAVYAEVAPNPYEIKPPVKASIEGIQFDESQKMIVSLGLDYKPEQAQQSATCELSIRARAYHQLFYYEYLLGNGNGLDNEGLYYPGQVTEKSVALSGGNHATYAVSLDFPRPNWHSADGPGARIFVDVFGCSIDGSLILRSDLQVITAPNHTYIIKSEDDAEAFHCFAIPGRSNSHCFEP